jgi:hypothetical protein
VAAVAAVLAAAPPASAKQGPISIRSVWIGDGQHTQRTVLNSGDKATYHIDVDNTTGETMSVEVSFEVFDIDGPSSYSYNYTGHNIAMPAGLSHLAHGQRQPGERGRYQRSGLPRLLPVRQPGE